MLSIKLLPETLVRYHRAITPKRVWNVAKVAASYALSNVFRRDIRMGKPFVLMVEPTIFATSNARCVPRAMAI